MKERLKNSYKQRDIRNLLRTASSSFCFHETGTRSTQLLIISASSSFFFWKISTGQLKASNHLSFNMFFNCRTFTRHLFFLLLGSYSFSIFSPLRCIISRHLIILAFLYFSTTNPSQCTPSFFSGIIPAFVFSEPHTVTDLSLLLSSGPSGTRTAPRAA